MVYFLWYSYFPTLSLSYNQCKILIHFSQDLSIFFSHSPSISIPQFPIRFHSFCSSRYWKFFFSFPWETRGFPIHFCCFMIRILLLADSFRLISSCLSFIKVSGSLHAICIQFERRRKSFHAFAMRILWGIMKWSVQKRWHSKSIRLAES